MNRPTQLPLDLAHRPALGREDFLVAPSNQDAVAWIDRWPDWPGPCLVIHGPEGSGKTHLAKVWQALSGARQWAGGDADWAHEGQACLVENATPDGGGEPLLHLFNTVAEANGTMLVTTRLAPARWTGGLPDLTSRLRAASTVAIDPPDDALMAAVLVKQFSDRQLPVDKDVIPYLVTRIERSFAAVGETAAALDAAALANRRKVTLSFVRDFLRAIDR